MLPKFVVLAVINILQLFAKGSVAVIILLYYGYSNLLDRKKTRPYANLVSPVRFQQHTDKTNSSHRRT